MSVNAAFAVLFEMMEAMDLGLNWYNFIKPSACSKLNDAAFSLSISRNRENLLKVLRSLSSVPVLYGIKDFNFNAIAVEWMISTFIS